MQGDDDGEALPLLLLMLFFNAGASASVYGRPRGAPLSGPQDRPSLPHKAPLPTCSCFHGSSAYISLRLSLGHDR